MGNKKMRKNKKSFALLLTLVLLTVFSYLITFIYETKALSSSNIKNQYLYIQGKNHTTFLKEYINSIDLEAINHLEIEDTNFKIEAFIKKEDTNYKIETIVESKKENIRIVNSFVK